MASNGNDYTFRNLNDELQQTNACNDYQNEIESLIQARRSSGSEATSLKGVNAYTFFAIESSIQNGLPFQHYTNKNGKGYLIYTESKQEEYATVKINFGEKSEVICKEKVNDVYPNRRPCGVDFTNGGCLSYKEINTKIKEFVDHNNCKEDNEKKLTKLLINFSKDGTAISVNELREIRNDKPDKYLQNFCQFINELCYLSFFKEIPQWLPLTDNDKLDTNIAVSHARSIILAREGKINLTDCFGGEYSVFDVHLMYINWTIVDNRMVEIKKMYDKEILKGKDDNVEKQKEDLHEIFGKYKAPEKKHDKNQNEDLHEQSKEGNMADLTDAMKKLATK
ncbi:unnamed protein product [Dimorphilus gyrociliatus]|uniref:Uncharacterized protein n=1 Tax=Dimorphilus gyrociliatus TaxID=2664684 RepID=A0A7I8VHH5_9ANNE|nr:unnamed protein product [Dimorphilus gyrociliatus]